MADRWLTFDCYGTIIDWRTGMTAALDSVAPGRSAELIDAYYRCEPEVEAEPPFRNYRAILTEGLRRAAASTGIPLEEHQFSVLADTLPTWPAFADSVPALQQLRDAGYKLGILTNTDADLFAQTLAGPLPIPFDEVITAQEVQSYKPGDPMFDTFVARHTPAPTDWIHVGNSVWHDCEPAHRRGFRTIFVHRSENAENNEWIHLSDSGQRSVTVTIPDLASLPGALHELS
ncbi:HAD family hydrolase [Mycolicibacterium helvum]|uniref:Haloacid dehalogenase n=1 Tax=Mycolicibacterium helvum TaxID=1534349 RepID=A0A7I7T0Z2_9MYCO|nr:HAD family hydrolase [Mycolicibacterium helvum]BBY62590.1 haloacid dehalogenase [Mycolicibacterium helvum]